MTVGHFQNHKANDPVVFGKPILQPQIPGHESGNNRAKAPLIDNDAFAPRFMGFERPEPNISWIQVEVYQ